MSNDTITLELQKRDVVRKRLSNLRGEGTIPAVIHNHGKDSILVEAEVRLLAKTFAAAGKNQPVQLSVDGKQHLALFKDVDFEPVKRQLRHVVFQAIKQNEAVEAEVPVVFAEGVEIPAEKLSLMVLKQIDSVVVKALPKNLPEELSVDPSNLKEVGDSLSVADIVLPAGVTLVSEPDVQIAIVEMPKDQVAEANAAAEALAEDAGSPAETADAENAAKPEESAE